MNLQRYPIIAKLQPYVKLICTMDCDDEAETRPIRVLPDTCVEVFVNYTNTPVAIIGNELFKRSIVTFRLSRPMDVQMRKGSGCLAICFLPGMAYKFMRLPMHVAADKTVALEEIWKGLATKIEDKLLSAPSNEARVTIVQQYLTELLADSKHDQQVADCLRQVHLSEKLFSVKELTDTTGLSQRQLLRRFQQTVGLSPKEYLRVSRFVRSLQQLKHYPACSLTEIAYESGYFDQAHFIRDYKAFSGCTPGEVVLSPRFLY